jgi:transposase
MTTPTVGPIVALTYAAAIDDPKRFRSSKATGAHFGLTRRNTNLGRPTTLAASPRSAMLPYERPFTRPRT